MIPPSPATHTHTALHQAGIQVPSQADPSPLRICVSWASLSTLDFHWDMQ